MSGGNRNFVFAYAFLVVLPLLGLAGVLKIGRHLAAPTSIDGVWNLQVDAAQMTSLPCAQAISAFSDQAFSISQSGPDFVINSLAGSQTIGSGSLEGNHLSATINSVPVPSQNSCGTNSNFTLLAAVEGPADSKILTGKLVAGACASCAPIPFRAERRPAAPSKAGH